MNWTVNLDNATFDFVELAWDESKVNRYPEDDPQGRGGQFAPADYKKGTAYQGSGSGGSSKNKNGSSSDSGGSKSGKSSGPARFQDSNGDGKDDRQLTPAELKKALSGLSADMRQALQIYPSVLGAIKMALENGEDPTKHLERLPSRLRGAAEKAAKSIASGSGSSGDPKGPIDVNEDTDEALVERLTAKGWAGNPSDSKERLYPPDHPKNPKNMSERHWAVDLDGASFDFSEVAWKQAE